jgi:hypothetical protein
MQAVPPSPDSRPAAEDRTAPNIAVLDGAMERVTFRNPRVRRCTVVQRHSRKPLGNDAVAMAGCGHAL